MKLRVFVLSLALFVAGRDASAALTTSEKAQVKDFVARGQLDNVGRVRSLVARTDSTAEESVGALVDAFAPVAFDEKRAAFARELVFGGPSAPSRPLLALAITKALLARADAIFQRYAGGLDHEPQAAAEIIALYSFLDDRVANAGRPTPAAHDPNSGIPGGTYEECSKAMRDHVDKNARWLKGDTTMGEVAGRVRAQAQVALLDMLPDGTTRRVDAADRLGLKGARRQILTDWGILLEDAGKLDDAAAERVRVVMTKLPGARVDLEVLYTGEDRGPLRARGIVAYAGGAADSYPFGDEIVPGAYDAEASAIAQDLSVLAARRALANRGELALQAERDAHAARGPAQFLGKLRAPSVDHAVGAAVHALVVDAPRAVDLAMVRLLDGHPESAALLSDAIGALAAFAPPGKSLDLDLGKPMTQIRLAPNGAAIAFTLDGHTWTLDRAAPTFALASARRDGQPVTLAQLATARTPLKDGTQWSDAGVTFTKVRGAPRAGILPSTDKNVGPAVKLVGTSAKGFDAIGTPAPGDDFVLEGDLLVTGGIGGIAIRAANGREAVRGAMLIVDPRGRTTLASSDDAGAEALLAAPIDPSPGMPVHVKISVVGTKVEATVGSATLNGTLPASLKKGELALVAKQGAHVELARMSAKKK